MPLPSFHQWELRDILKKLNQFLKENFKHIGVNDNCVKSFSFTL